VAQNEDPTSNGVRKVKPMLKLAHYGIAASIFVVAASLVSAGQNFKQYPGAKLDDKISPPSSTRLQTQIYVSPDSYDKVVAFYKPLYKEYAMPSGGPMLPSGKQIQWSFFLVDGAKDLSESKSWIKIQYPYVGSQDFKDIRNVTVIQVVSKVQDDAHR
jgi:hypothetical protein